MSNDDQTIKADPSVPAISSGTHQQGEQLLHTGVMQPPQAPGTIGTIGKYQVLRVLGEGGMGQVLLGRDPVTDSLVAIKIIKAEYLQKDWAVHRFLTEARHMFKLVHPSIIRVLEVSERPEGPYFIMPYLSGGSLAQKIKPGESLPAEEILSVGRNVAEALHYAHAHGIIHRDLKPSNILLDGEGRAFLCDFGLLRTVFNDSIVDVTRPQMEGTVPYMSPAVAEGKAEDTRCDIYGFGCLLYEMLTGQPPYQGPSVDTILKQIQAGPPQPIRQVNPNAPAHLVAIAEGAMARELRDRYAAMADVIADLERVRQRKAPLGPHGHVLRSRPGRMIAGIVGIVALLGLVAFGVLHFLNDRAASHPQTNRNAPPATATLSQPAATPQEDFTYTTNNGAVTITKYTGPGGDVTIPSTISGLPVTSIGDRSFQNCASLTRVSIPNGVTNIGDEAFNSCSGLTNAVISAGVSSMVGNPFSACHGLISILVDVANPAYCSSADGVVFNKEKTCLVMFPGGLTSDYAIPEGVTIIGHSAFAGCSLTSVKISDSVKSIGGRAFLGCTGLITITIPDSVTDIGAHAFWGCASLTKVTIPKSVTSIGSGLFNACDYLTLFEVHEANSAFCNSDDGVLFNKKKTRLVCYPGGKTGGYVIPDGVKSIGETAFGGCANLTTITIPEGVTEIEPYAFGSCSKLANVVIPDSVTSIAGYSFCDCRELTSVVVGSANRAYSSSADGVVFNKEKTCLVRYPAGKTGSYVIPDSVTKISHAAFSGCAKLTSVTIPHSVTTIEESSFYNCDSITAVYFKGDVPYLGPNAFLGCNKATIYYPPGAKGWGPQFGGRPTAPWNPEATAGLQPTPPQIPFTYTTNNGTVTITKYTGPGGDITIPSTINGLPVTGIWDRAFKGCSAVTGVVLPASITSIGSWAFENCTALTTVTIPPTVTHLGFDAFSGCTSLTNVTLPDGITGIFNATFKDCSSLVSLTIPSGVTSIGMLAFAGCTSLTSVYFKGDAPQLGQNAFGGCTKATIHYLPGAKDWGGEFGGRPTAPWNPEAQTKPATKP